MRDSLPRFERRGSRIEALAHTPAPVYQEPEPMQYEEREPVPAAVPLPEPVHEEPHAPGHGRSRDGAEWRCGRASV